MREVRENKRIMRNTWAEINLDNIVHNLKAAREIVSPNTKIAAVLKANAYGHGAVHTARVLIENHIDMLCVACTSEALELRRHFSKIPILVMGYTPDEHLEISVEKDITLTIFSLEQAEKVSSLANGFNKTAKLHIKVDTGFNRLGIKPGKDTADIISKIYNLKNIEVEGIFTHLALRNPQSDERQFELFWDLVSKLEENGIKIPIKHVCDSIAMVRYPKYHLDMVRPGAFIYGCYPKDVDKGKLGLKNTLTFKTRLSRVQEIGAGEGVGYDESFVVKDKCVVGTLPVGYADGYMRCLSGKAEVGIRGKRARVMGLICMDQCMIDLTDIPEARPGDEVVLMGEGPEITISNMEVSLWAGTNRNEVLSAISRRVPRVYIKDGKIIDVVDYILD
ncbi:alanine racemase [Fonticella tunisiensis]|uniref:Alanine racemase n=1 Tax=Fonticella tunisiensis TaxID=1096341 RepID=A0A4R7KB06_9CLOT|nr:alanine racemase [Fonticella tunisiensis]TDT50270.1 alanine racemase [Fonticella tunisiensis]